mmetsp:Transcript_66550/g.214473  ORF Transcript_66550/g.214473 Transcript_66550/m.214473 type:complete len:153 (+) Transcript_66550:83-541(+)
MAELTDVKFEDLTVVSACCCTINSLFCKTPDCIGGKAEGICICIQQESSFCKLMDPNMDGNEDKKCMVCFEGGSYCVKPTTCIQQQTQCFCLDSRASFPCSDKVPCVFTICPFVVLMANWKFKPGVCQKGASLMKDQDEVENVNGPGQEEMK